jgi:thiosulfate/3-mercaptopyruvate sulfurtransferase
MTRTLPPLIEPQALADLTATGLLVIHVAEPAAYRQAHVPGALLVTPRDLISGQPPAPGKLPDAARLNALFAALGYRPDLDIVVYDDEGGGWAGRFIWTLDVIGHRHWSYLDGGIHAWRAAGMPLETGPGRHVDPVAVSLELDSAPIAELEDVLAAIGDDTQLIWDVRSGEEYRGEKGGSRRAGHVPTAVNLDWMALKDPSRQLRLVADLEALLATHGIDRRKRVITHCQTHHRSGLSYLCGRLLGFREIRGYHGSWAEWGNRDDTPVVTGPEPGGPEDGAPR